MQIRKITLYNSRGDKRSLDFRLGSVNVITGQSGTGKSSILNIIDYCLGKSEFLVSEGMVRDTVTWYSILLQLSDTQVLIAKPAPSGNSSSQSQVYMKVGREILTPDLSELVPNANDGDLVKLVSSQLGIGENQVHQKEGSAEAPLEANLRHALAFCLQGQGEVANQNILFHRQDEKWYSLAIVDTLPYFLGAYGEESVRLQRALREARRERRIAERRLREAKDLAAEGLVRGRSLVAEAEATGLVEPENRSFGDPTELLAFLRRLDNPRQLTAKEPSDDRLVQLRISHEEHLLKYREVLGRIRSTEAVLVREQHYSDEAAAQAGRLSVVELFGEDINKDLSRCPVCETELPNLTPSAAAIRRNLEKLRSELSIVSRERPKLDKHLGELRGQLDGLKNQLNQDEASIAAIESESEVAEARLSNGLRAARVLGRISLYLEAVGLDNAFDSLEKDAQSTGSLVESLEQQLEALNVGGLIESALSSISATMTQWANELALEFAGSPYRLDIKRLTVVSDRNGRPVSMPNMGGGSNWLGCHLIAMLALLKYMADTNQPTPRFLVLDQPTQVFYPPDKSGSALEPKTGGLEELRDEDRIAVERMFRFLFSVCESMKKKLQIIVIDHAELSDSQFQASIIDQPWRYGHALIPDSWKV